MTEAFTFVRRGRTPRTILLLAAIWAALALAWLRLEASPLILGFLALFTLPALWDVWRDPESRLRLTETHLGWTAGTQKIEVPLRDIDHVRMDTRLDLSVRTTLVLKTGARLRLPFAATPPHRAFEEALDAHGITTRRTHFQLMQ